MGLLGPQNWPRFVEFTHTWLPASMVGPCRAPPLPTAPKVRPLGFPPTRICLRKALLVFVCIKHFHHYALLLENDFSGFAISRWTFVTREPWGHLQSRVQKAVVSLVALPCWACVYPSGRHRDLPLGFPFPQSHYEAPRFLPPSLLLSILWIFFHPENEVPSFTTVEVSPQVSLL